MRSRTLVAPLLLTLVLGCDGSDDGATDEVGDTDEETEGGDTDGDTTETTDGGPVDTDEDGLTDDEELELGTDPTKKDTDGDNYWDSWEVTEGTDPLDVESRIYIGYWPYNPNKDLLEQGSWANASKDVGTPFPRDEFLDHHGDMVDLYDFTNFTVNATNEPAYFIFDLSAQWCGPCHNVASWISGVDDANTSWIQGLYPTVRDKVHGLRIWWITFVVENSAGGAPTAADGTTWFSTHHDNYIPIMSDLEQEMWPNYGSNAYPHFFLLDPEMRIEYFPGPTDGTDANPYPAVGLVDTLL
ncbi:hypothetical protein ACNOYE_10560 [Nannocystaceae bacterium ST9]